MTQLVGHMAHVHNLRPFQQLRVGICESVHGLGKAHPSEGDCLHCKGLAGRFGVWGGAAVGVPPQGIAPLLYGSNLHASNPSGQQHLYQYYLAEYDFTEHQTHTMS